MRHCCRLLCTPLRCCAHVVSCACQDARDPLAESARCHLPPACIPTRVTVVMQSARVNASSPSVKLASSCLPRRQKAGRSDPISPIKWSVNRAAKKEGLTCRNAKATRANDRHGDINTKLRRGGCVKKELYHIIVLPFVC